MQKWLFNRFQVSFVHMDTRIVFWIRLRVQTWILMLGVCCKSWLLLITPLPGTQLWTTFQLRILPCARLLWALLASYFEFAVFGLFEAVICQNPCFKWKTQSKNPTCRRRCIQKYDFAGHWSFQSFGFWFVVELTGLFLNVTLENWVVQQRRMLHPQGRQLYLDIWIENIQI